MKYLISFIALVCLVSLSHAQAPICVNGKCYVPSSNGTLTECTDCSGFSATIIVRGRGVARMRGNDCGCSFGAVCKCAGACACNGVLPTGSTIRYTNQSGSCANGQCGTSVPQSGQTSRPRLFQGRLFGGGFGGGGCASGQ